MGKKEVVKNDPVITDDIRLEGHSVMKEVENPTRYQKISASDTTEDLSKSNRKLSRERKIHRVESLRRRNLGYSMGHINVEKSASKIKRFDEDDSTFQDKMNCVTQGETPYTNVDDDDAMEEVKASDAKEKVLQQLAQEQSIAQEEFLFTQKKKKRSKKGFDDASHNIADDLDDQQSLDDALLDMVDSNKQLLLKKITDQQGLQQPTSQKRNNHITFNLGSDNEEGTLKNPLQAGHNIQLVVLPVLGHTIGQVSSETLGIAPSETAMRLCRNRLTAEKALIAMETTKVGQKVQQKNGSDYDLVKRSRKSKYYIRCGRSAANFKVK